MGETEPGEQPVENPTYMGDIRHFFEQEDIDCMAGKGIDLATYNGVKSHAGPIYIHTLQPGGDMPLGPGRKWSAARSQTFKNWILAKFPVGTATFPTAAVMRLAAAAPPVRLRKNVANLSQPEIDALTKAFKGLMAKDPSDLNSYCAVAGIHGLPQSNCLHHEDRFNPWHRVYLKTFEDALRSVPGCENVTLPYWDIKTPVPALLKTPPFDSYVVPVALSGGFGANYKTERSDQAQIDAGLAKRQVFSELDTALNQSLWGVSGQNGFQDSSIKAHDGGHLSIGPTMAQQEVSSYDPIFWFYHCNLDRHWLSWQRNARAETLAGFKSTLSGDTDWLSDATIYALTPWTMTSDSTIDHYAGIGYDQLMTGPAVASLENKFGSMAANRTFTIRRSAPVSVLVKDIDRLSIPGSFDLVLLADGEPIATRAFFQPNRPRDCPTCRKLGLVSINFRVDQDQILDKKLSIAIEVTGQKGMDAGFPLSSAGNPTINVRLLLEDG
jgi:tyrosinase